jgi:hypothetical protein
MISAKPEHYTCMVDFLACAGCLEEADNIMKQCPVNHVWLHWGLCSALAEFLVMWRWQNVLQNEFLNCSLKMLLLMCCYQPSMLLLATGVSRRMFNSRYRNNV